MSNGHQYTVPAAQALEKFLAQSSYQVVYDHGSSKKSQKIIVWYQALSREQQLAHLDIAVVDYTTAKILAVIEIEDTTNSPKKLLGNVMAMLLGDGIAIKGKSDWKIGEWTSFYLFAYCQDGQKQARIQQKLVYFEQQLQALLAKMTTQNAMLQQLTLQSFVTNHELNEKIGKLADRILSQP